VSVSVCECVCEREIVLQFEEMNYNSRADRFYRASILTATHVGGGFVFLFSSSARFEKSGDCGTVSNPPPPVPCHLAAAALARLSLTRSFAN